MLEQTDTAVATLINKFNELTPQLMQTFKQQIQFSYAQDIVGLAICGLFLIASIIGLILAYRFGKDESWGGNEMHWSMAKAMTIMVCCVILLGTIVLSISIGLDLMQLSINPDYYILKNYIMPLIA
jgi:uncharacterized BrkB/YihY/UPF0761 family membrane protein